VRSLIAPGVLAHPRAGRLAALYHAYVDNFVPVWDVVNWGFLGFASEYREEEIEHLPGVHRRVRRTHDTVAGRFDAVTLHPADGLDYHWEKRFVSTVDDLCRLAETPRSPIVWNCARWQEAERQVGDRGLPVLSLLHPLGGLLRNSDLETVYTWFHDEAPRLHRFLEAANRQTAAAAAGLLEAGIRAPFMTWAHELMIPPWAGTRLFDEFVVPYDTMVNRTIHAHGGRRRAHCHGRCGAFLERFAAMGIDSVEPLEHAPAGDVDLAEAKRTVGRRMLLSGNVADESFHRRLAADVREEVRQAICVGAPGGGFTLRTSGSDGGTGMIRDDADLVRAIGNCEVYILAALEFGQYPIQA